MQQKITILKDKILNLMYPKNIKCMFCTDELNENSKNCTCENCLNALPFIVNECNKCGVQLSNAEKDICSACKTKNYYFDKAKAVFEFKDLPQEIIHNLKYYGKKYLVEYINNYLVEIFNTWGINVDIVTCVPTFKDKEKERGYNQSQELAKEFAKSVNIKFLDLLDKVVDTKSQTSLNIKERLNNVKDSFKLKTEVKPFIKDKVILVVDDVITTGATTNEVSKMLKDGGANKCFVLTFAHTTLDEEVD